MTKLQEKLKEAKRLQELSHTYNDKSDILKGEIWDSLESEYTLVLQRDERDKYSWKSQGFGDELQLLLSSMIKVDKVIHVPGNLSSRGFNLTQKHGLKWPRTWSSYPFLPYRSAPPSFIKGLYKAEVEQIDFSVLEDNRIIDTKKLLKFFYFLDEIIKLYKVFWNIEKDFEKNFPSGEGLRSLSSYSALETYGRFLVQEPKLRDYYVSYERSLKRFKKKQDKLFQELKEYNKPFRLLLALKK